MKHYGPMPQQGRRYKRRPGAYALLTRGNGALLTVENSPVAGVEIQLPGGGIDPGESPVQALHREVMEETGWTMASPRRLGAFRRFVFMPEYDLWADKICTIYVARPVRRLGPPLEDGHTAIWMPRDQATRLLANVGDRHFAQRARV